MKQKSGKFFEVSVAYEKNCEDGLVRKTVDKVVVEAFSCGEAETRVLEEIAPVSCGETECLDIVTAPYKEIFFADSGDIFFKAKIRIITLSDNGKEKKTTIYHLTNAENIECARKNIVEAYGGSMLDYTISGLNETKITEVYEKK